MKINYYAATDMAEKDMKYVVIATRYMDKWVFYREHNKSTWDLPSGIINSGESPINAARRVLITKIGATEFEINETVAFGIESDGDKVYGMMYYADIKSIGDIRADGEITEIKSFDFKPDSLTYPDIQPELFRRIHSWINNNHCKGELWDIYDENRNLTGRTHRRGDFMKQGDYHLVVLVWIQNKDGEFLLAKRTPNKGYPNMWEAAGGSALAGDDSLSSAIREVKEELGFDLDPKLGKIIHTYRTSDCFVDVWLFKQDFDIKKAVLQENETGDVMYASRERILELKREGKFVPTPYLDIVFDNAD